MWETAAIVALSVAVTAFALGWWRQAVLARRAARRSAEHDAEEQRVFEYLHELGEMLYHDVSARQVHRRIVRGVSDVIEARGGALYLYDAARHQLVPAFISRDCPPLIELPPEMAAKLTTDAAAVHSFIQLQAIPAEAGVLGDVWSSGRPLALANLRDHPAFASVPAVSAHAIAGVFSPLTYGAKKLGVLAAARMGRQRTFSGREFDVFKSLAGQSAFALGGAIVHQEVLEKRLIEDELRRASVIQRILLPGQPPLVDGFALAAAYQPAKVVSGDYYDFLPLDADHIGVVIADVSGKGIPASLVMATCRGLLRVCAQSAGSPAAVLRQVNRMLFADIREDMFVSLAYCVIDTRTGETTLARAGHDPPLLYRAATKTIEAIQSPGLALGVDRGAVFDRATRDFGFRIEPGDCLLLYTDGVTEALDRVGVHEFGNDRLREAFLACMGDQSGSAGLVAGIQQRLVEFVDGRHPHDDLTLVAIERLGSAQVTPNA